MILTYPCTLNKGMLIKLYCKDYDYKKSRSTDFTILSRYGGVLWDIEWLEYNGMFAWHVNTEEEKIDMARKRNELTMDKISEMFDLGMNPFKTI